MKKIMLLCIAAMIFVACNKEEDLSDNNNDPIPAPIVDGIIPNAVTDYDGNSYDAVRLGDQVWLASNLRTTHYANGDSIPRGTAAASFLDPQYFSATDPYYYVVLNNDSYITKYGCYYNWTALMHGTSGSSLNPSGVQGVCPTGWHVPSYAEWEQLCTYCKSKDEYVCGEFREIAKALSADYSWSPPPQQVNVATCSVGNDVSANNATGFCAVPAGTDGYGGIDNYVYMWSATEADNNKSYYFYIPFGGVNPAMYPTGRSGAFSVRCIKD